ncbi:hypothetical protein AXG93_3228s1150 [Marchantia polymorpha subsp. ruderalis]|uniref:Desiccation-related protein PCC13-62 n=1 Tax=Marchantia polymorpha subsp. ruderalis TaxID=1480154 RepID=A0A176WH72_MARPO|nr:hypothetical protein AXG93_3228s1150 [Marchantia polymorpha subsp. ruderalis]
MSSSIWNWFVLLTVASVAASEVREVLQGNGSVHGSEQIHVTPPGGTNVTDPVHGRRDSGNGEEPTRGFREPGRRRHAIPTMPSPWPPRNTVVEKSCPRPKRHRRFTKHDEDVINVALNVEYLLAEFFLHAAFGQGLDGFDPELSNAGPAPIGGEKAHLGHRLVEKVAKESGFQGMGHIRLIRSKLKGKAVPRPQLDISRSVWARFLAQALEQELIPPFNPYNDTISFLIAAQVLPYAALSAYFDQSSHIVGQEAQKLLGGLLSITSAQDAILRTLLYQHREETLKTYNLTVAQITDKISTYCTRLIQDQEMDETVFLPFQQLSEQNLVASIVTVDKDFLPLRLSTRQVLGLLYGSGNASVPGAFFPQGAVGKIADKFLRH